MKKILIIITKGETGGAQVSVFNLAKKLIEQGLDVTVGFGSGTFLQQKLEKQQIPYTKFPDLGRTFNIITNLRFIWKFKKFLNSNHFDVVHFNSSNALLGALSAKLAKNVLNLTNGSSVKMQSNGLKKYLWLLLILVIAESGVIAWLYLLKPVSPYQKLLPPNAVASAYFNQNTLLNLIKSQRSASAAWKDPHSSFPDPSPCALIKI